MQQTPYGSGSREYAPRAPCPLSREPLLPPEPAQRPAEDPVSSADRLGCQPAQVVLYQPCSAFPDRACRSLGGSLRRPDTRVRTLEVRRPLGPSARPPLGAPPP